MGRRFLIWLTILACISGGCVTGTGGSRQAGAGGPEDLGPSAAESLGQILQHHDSLVAPLVAQLNLAFWQWLVEGSPAAHGRLLELELLIREHYADGDRFATLTKLADAGKIADPSLARQLTLLLGLYRENQSPAKLREDLIRSAVALEEIHARIPWQTDAEVLTVLMAEPDGPVRRAAWEKALERGALVSAGLLELVRMRNRAARALGFADFYQMRIRLDGMDPKRLEALADRVARETEAPFAEVVERLGRRLAKRFEIEAKDVMPWHYGDPFFQRPPLAVGLDLDPLFDGRDSKALAQATFARLGWNATEVLGRADLAIRPDKPAMAFCLDVDRAGDVRILASVQPGARPTETLLHELGHAFYYSHLPGSLPWLLRQPASEALGEAVALLFGDLVRDEGWLADVLGVPTRRLDIRRVDLRQQSRDELLVFVRFCLLMIHFERELYRDPEQDLVKLWWDLKARYQHMQRPAGRNAPDWAAKLHLVSAPVYFHNYLLGQVAASQIRDHLGRSGLGPVWSQPAGRFLVEKIIAPGASQGWEQVLEDALGRKLDPGPLVRAVSGRSAPGTLQEAP